MVAELQYSEEYGAYIASFEIKNTKYAIPESVHCCKLHIMVKPKKPLLKLEKLTLHLQS